MRNAGQILIYGKIQFMNSDHPLLIITNNAIRSLDFNYSALLR